MKWTRASFGKGPSSNAYKSKEYVTNKKRHGILPNLELTIHCNMNYHHICSKYAKWCKCPCHTPEAA